MADIVYDKNNPQLYQGNSQYELEKNAIITEEQINYVAKDVRDFLEQENYVSYNSQNPTLVEQETAITNIFGDGILEAKIANVLNNLATSAKGLTILDQEDNWVKQAFTDIANGKRKLFILTPQAKVEEYGIPILSEYFEDINYKDVIYKKTTYEELFKNEPEWIKKYKNALKNTTNAWVKNKWHFADFAKVCEEKVDASDAAAYNLIFGGEADVKKERLLTGLYNTQVGGSISAFVEYVALPWETFVPEKIGSQTSSLSGAILFQPSTGNIYEVTANSEGITANTALSLQVDKNNTNQYRPETIYNWEYQDRIKKTFGDPDPNEPEATHTYFIDEANALYLILKSMTPGVDESVASGADSELVNGSGHTTIRNHYELMMQENKDIVIGKIGNTDYKLSDFIKRENMVTGNLNEENNKIYYTTHPKYNVSYDSDKTEDIVNQNEIPRITSDLNTYLGQGGEISAVFNNNVWQGSSLFRPVINIASPRIYYHIPILNEEIYGENIVKEYPHGAMALHCVKRGTINTGNIWQFCGDLLYSGGIEYPGGKVYQKLLGYNNDNTPRVNDYIYNPYSSELRRVYRPQTIAENGSGRESFLTEDVLTYINNEVDGATRAGGTYIRGNNITYLSPNQQDQNINKIAALPGFIEYLQSQQGLNDSYFHGLSDYIEQLKKYQNNILNNEQDKTKLVFNTLYLLPKVIQEKISSSEVNNSLRTEIRFKQLNHMIPGDFVLSTENNFFNLYQTTSAPYLYDIFKDYPEGREIFINFACYLARNATSNRTLLMHDVVLRDILITELKNAGLHDGDDFKLYHFKKDESSDEIQYPYIWNGSSYAENNHAELLETCSSLIEWLKLLKEEYPNLDIDTIYNYRKNENDVEYLKDLRYRLLTNLQCPIGIDAIPITSLPFTINIEDGSSIEFDPTRIIIPEGSISEVQLASNVVDKLNSFKILLSSRNPSSGGRYGDDTYVFDLTSLPYPFAGNAIPAVNDVIICNQSFYQVGEIQSDYVVTTKIGDLSNKIISYNDLDNSLQTKIDNAYVKPSGGIPLSDLNTSVKNKINAPNMRYLMDYETITYDSDVGEYIFNSTNKTESRKNYKDGSLILSPSNDVFQLNSPDGAGFRSDSSTPTFVYKISNDNNNIFEFYWRPLYNSYEYEKKIGEDLYDSITENDLLLAKEILQKRGSITLKFIDGDFGGKTIIGGSLTQSIIDSINNIGIVFNYYDFDDSYNPQVKQLIWYYFNNQNHIEQINT